MTAESHRASSPGRGVALALAVGAMLACGGEAFEDDGSLRGRVVTFVADFKNRREVRYRLQPASGDSRALLFEHSPDLEPGALLRVWGQDGPDGFRVARFEVEPVAEGEDDGDGIEERQSALIGATPKPARRWAFVLVNLGTGVGLTKEEATRQLFGETGSIRSYYREASYGIQEIEGEVFGPLAYKLSSCSDAAMDALARALKPMVPGRFNQYLWYFGREVDGCGWAGLASFGTATRPAQDTWFNGDSSCGVLIQEPGHNFGMDHSSSMRCSTAAGVPASMVLPGQGSCGHNEYGNPFDPMGDGCGHMGAVQKAYQDWLSACNVVKVTGSGTFTLYPIEQACSGVQMLQIPIPNAPRVLTMRDLDFGGTVNAALTSYYLELRAPLGIDAKLSPRVLVVAAGDVRDARAGGRRNWLVDTNPGTASASDSGMVAGRVFKDPAPNGPTITVVSLDATKATIKVELAGGGAATGAGRGTCDDGTAFMAPGPDRCEGPVTVPLAGDGGAGPVGADGGTSADSGGLAPIADAAGSTPGTPEDASPWRPVNPNRPPPSLDAGEADPVDARAPALGGNGNNSGGCSCRVAGDFSSAAEGRASAWLMLALPALLAWKRRRRGRGATCRAGSAGR